MEFSIDTLTLGLIWFVVFLFSTTCHEGAHALVGKLGGDVTAAEQVTFNPIPHIHREPFGMVVVPVLSFFLSGWMIGWASAPYDRGWAYRRPHRAARMALAGPAANFTLMILAAIGIRAGLAAGWFQAPEAIRFERITEAIEPSGLGSLAAIVLSIVFMLNFVLGTFNLLPVPPLDGNAAVTILMSEEQARRFMGFFEQGFGMIGLLIAWIFFGRVFGFLFPIVLNLLYSGIVAYN